MVVARSSIVSFSLLPITSMHHLVDPIGSDNIRDTTALQSIKHFMDHNGLANRKKTHVAQKKKTAKEEIEDFTLCIAWKNHMLGTTDDHAVANTDKANVYFSPSFECTIANKEAKTVTVAEPNLSSRCTTMLGASLGGEKLPPYIIF